MNVLTMQDVRKSFGSLEVLKGISLAVGEGEAVSVIGPSGSGKSTLLRCATLLETMDGGSLAYGNDFAATMDAEGKSVYADKAALLDHRLLAFGSPDEVFAGETFAALFPGVAVEGTGKLAGEGAQP